MAATSNIAAPPRWAALLLTGLYRLEATVAVAAFAGITGALFFDLLGREVFGTGIFVAQRFAVYCMVVLAFLGFALAVGWQAHLGIEVAEQLTPASWNRIMSPLADLVAAGGCVFMAFWSFRFVADSYVDQSRGQALEILLWPVQSILIWCFVSSAVRYLAYAIWPRLRDASPRV